MPLEYIEIDDPKNRDYVQVRPSNYANIPVALPNWEPEPVCLTSRYKKIGQQIKDMEIRPDDVWMTGHAKSGTTWCKEMVWLICNDLDYKAAASVNLMQRFPFVELGLLKDYTPDPFQEIVKMSSPRFIKTHLPVSLLPDQMWTVKPRLVHVRRNLKGVAVSGYHHLVSLQEYKGTMDDYLESVLHEVELYSPYHSQVIEYNNLNYGENILHLCYEDMKKDLKSELKRVCAFFNKTYSDEQLDTLAEHLSFDKMKDNRSVNFASWVENILKETNRMDKLNDENYKLVRRGKSDGWKTELTVEQQQLLDEWTRSKVFDPEHLKLFQ